MNKWVIYPVNADGERIGEKKRCGKWVWRHGELYSTRDFKWFNNKKKSHMRVDHCRLENVKNPELWLKIRIGNTPSFVDPGAFFELNDVKIDKGVAALVLCEF